MNRIIKFRAWDKIDKEWYQWGKFSISEQEIYIHDGTCSYLWDRFEIMQFTGLLDRHGKEIYEGDLVKGQFQYSDEKKKHEAIVEVKYSAPHHGLAGFHIWPINVDEFPIEVIGNVFQNKELLTQSK